jgi:2-aminoadipate transaminase
MSVAWGQQFAHRVQYMRPSAIRELLKVTQNPEVISFAGGLPAAELFPIAEIDAASHKVLAEHGTQALQYGTAEGYQPLREHIARMLSVDGLILTADNILITSGAQQGLDLVGKVLLDEGDTVLVDAPTYMSALQAWNIFGAKYRTTPIEGDIVRGDELHGMLAQGAKWIYTMPNFQNPTGLTLTLEQRQQLVTATNRHHSLIVEDDPYQRLRFEGEALPSLMQLANRLQEPGTQYQGNVIYLGTFSKIMAPGLRVGWIAASAPLIDKLVLAKQGTDLQASTFTQMLVYEFTRSEFQEEHIERICTTYRERRDYMLDAMKRHFPDTIRWTKPKGGMFLWVVLPEGINANELLKEALKNNVAFVPGTTFFTEPGHDNTLRLNFSYSNTETIEEGIKRLGAVFARMGIEKVRG